MASPGGENMLSTPPTTATGAPNPSPPTASSTQPNTQNTQPAQTNGSAPAPMSASFPSTSLQDTGTSKRPRDARLIHLILANMGVHAYTERVPLQLLDFAYRYTNGILSDAISYEGPQTNVGKKAAPKDDDGISLNALRTAIHARAQQQFSSVLPKEFMSEVAAERNKVALPRVEREWGLRLPPERYCFTGVGWGMKESWEEDEEVGEEMDGVAGLTGGPVGGGDTAMGGVEDEEVNEDEFEEVMGSGNKMDTSG
ncbi:Transcription initiation factor TFIID subunit 9 [Paraconiothyrium brasiliense]|uniref:Transcription initiation factor TFIID subunit 9 n=1 Tax=Paraconiothyrium brasiliense TaxID=300254 RepID=A0ABR3S7Z5_9PLEO